MKPEKKQTLPILRHLQMLRGACANGMARLISDYYRPLLKRTMDAKPDYFIDIFCGTHIADGLLGRGLDSNHRLPHCAS